MKITKLQISIVCFCFLFLMVGNAQDEMIHLNNPSFEDYARPGKVPRGWYDCGGINFPLESPPDIHPVRNQKGGYIFDVTQKAFDGKTYVGMVVRANDSWESIAQKLKKPLSPGSCYSFSIYLCKSEFYKSGLRGKKEVVDFTTPIKLRIWGGDDFCDKRELLAESSLVENTDWQNYYFNFQPKKHHEFIILEAYFHLPTMSVPNGNIIIDHGSSIILVSCNSEERKEQLAKFEAGRNDFDLKDNSELSFDKTTKKELGAYEDKVLESQIKEFGPKIKFKSNLLTLQGELALRRILGSLLERPNHKLIIDFGGLKEKRFQRRKESLELAAKNWSAPFTNLEIINSKSENKEVKWLVEKDHLYIGIVKNE